MRLLVKQNFQIIIINDSDFTRCNSCCGVDWSLATNRSLASQLIQERFAKKIVLKYLDLSQPVTDNLTLKWQRKVNQENLPLPLLVINGEIRISGEFDLRMLLDVIDTEIEIKSYR